MAELITKKPGQSGYDEQLIERLNETAALGLIWKGFYTPTGSGTTEYPPFEVFGEAYTTLIDWTFSTGDLIGQTIKEGTLISYGDTEWGVVSSTINQADLALKADIATTINNTNEAQTKLGNFDLGQNIVVSSWSFVTTTITINTAVVHNLNVGDTFYVSGLVSTTNTPNGKWVVLTVEDTDTITFTALLTPTGTPTVSSAILVSGITSISATEWLNDGVDIGAGETLYPDGTIYGSNANGEYWKFLDGRLKGTITIEYLTSFTLRASPIYDDIMADQPFPFPATVVDFTSVNIQEAPRWAEATGTSLTAWTTPTLFAVTATNFTATIKFYMEGRWK